MARQRRGVADPVEEAVDAGDNAVSELGAVTTELDGKPRFRNASVDFGAYETNYCPADGDGNGSVGIVDFMAVFATWGPCGGPCPTDVDADGMVGINDSLTLLGAWGSCP